MTAPEKPPAQPGFLKRATWPLVLFTGIALISAAFVIYDADPASDGSLLIGTIGFFLCIIWAGATIDRTASILSGRHEDTSDPQQPEIYSYELLVCILTVLFGVAIITAAYMLHDTVLPEGPSVLMGVIGAMLIVFGLQQFLGATIAAMFRPLWRVAWIRTLGIIAFVLLMAYGAFLSFVEKFP